MQQIFGNVLLSCLLQRQADVAQLVEQPIRNRQVSGSSPLVGSILSRTYHQFTETCCTTAARAIFLSSCFMALITTLSRLSARDADDQRGPDQRRLAGVLQGHCGCGRLNLSPAFTL